MYALLRADLGMGPGKCSSQAGHAYLGSFLQASEERRRDYHADGIGTKVCLAVANEGQLHLHYARLRALGLPCVLIEDGGRNTIFNGVPTCTAVGVGPLYANEWGHLKKLPLMP